MHRHTYRGPIVYKDHCLVDIEIRQSLINQSTTTNMLEVSWTKYRNPTVATSHTLIRYKLSFNSPSIYSTLISDLCNGLADARAKTFYLEAWTLVFSTENSYTKSDPAHSHSFWNVSLLKPTPVTSNCTLAIKLIQLWNNNGVNFRT